MMIQFYIANKFVILELYFRCHLSQDLNYIDPPWRPHIWKVLICFNNKLSVMQVATVFRFLSIFIHVQNLGLRAVSKMEKHD